MSVSPCLDLQDDVHVLSTEVESLQGRLQAAANESSGLQNRLNEALERLSTSEQALDVKLREHKDLLVQYG